MRTYTASPMSLFLAKLFGDWNRHTDTITDGDDVYRCEVECYRWRGTYYVTKVVCGAVPTEGDRSK